MKIMVMRIMVKAMVIMVMKMVVDMMDPKELLILAQLKLIII